MLYIPHACYSSVHSFFYFLFVFPLAFFPLLILPSLSPSTFLLAHPTSVPLYLHVLPNALFLPSSMLPPVLSPPMSPGYGGDEAAHVKAILEGVFHTQEVGQEAVAKLCNHVKADPQEQQVEQ